MKEMVIEGRKIGKDNSPFIIAEMSGNHNQSLQRALEIVEAAAKSGVHALKLQTFTPDSLTLDVKSEDFCVDEQIVYGKVLIYMIYMKKHTLHGEWHKIIFDKCKKLGLICFSTH